MSASAIISSSFGRLLSTSLKSNPRLLPAVGRKNVLAANFFGLSLRQLSASSAVRSQIYFTEKHEWVKVDGKTGTVGISNYAQEALGDVVYAQLPEVDEDVEAGVDCGALESVKAASEIYSPVSGKVVEKNENVENTPGLINSSPMEEGWLFKLEISNPDELKSLLDQQAYDNFLKSQEE